jgi:hypothetical protein
MECSAHRPPDAAWAIKMITIMKNDEKGKESTGQPKNLLRGDWGSSGRGLWADWDFEEPFSAGGGNETDLLSL